MASTQDLGLNLDDFVNPAVLGSANPDPVLGYVHGPIPDANPGWRPAAYNNPIAPGERRREIKVADVEGVNAPPNPVARLSKLNGGVCWVAVDGQEMCGKVFAETRGLRRHIRNTHSGAVANCNHTGITQAERIIAENALKYYCLTGGWRDASFRNEPGRGPAHGCIAFYCDALERIAREDAKFAATYGERFHRDGGGNQG